MNKIWTLIVQPDPLDADGALLEFPPDLLEEAGWQSGDVLVWHDNKDGTWTLSKKDKSKRSK